MKRFLSVRHIALVVASAMSSLAFAQSPTDWGELVPGEVYSYEAMVPVQGYYTPSETGMIRCYSSGSDIHPYADPEHTQILQASNSYYGPNGEKVRVYSVTQDQTVYFFNSFPLDGGSFRFSVGKENVEVAGVSPEPQGSIMSLSENYRLYIMFSIPVKCTKCKMEINGESAEVSVDASDSMLIVNWYNTLLGWYQDGKIAEGDILTVTLTGIRDENDSSNRPDFGDGVGKLVMSYTMAAKPAQLIREINTPADGVTDFFTFYLPDGDEGLVSLVFDKDLSEQSLPLACLKYGDPDNLDFGIYEETLPVSVDGCTLTVDLRGVTRFPNDMIPGLPALPNIYLSISNVRSADGQYVLTGQASNPYSFGFTYNLVSVVYSIAADWLPLPGSVIEAGDEMEIWVLNGNRISFDSVDFAFKKNGEDAQVSVPYADLTATSDPGYEDAMIFSLTVPSLGEDPDSEIFVSFGGLKCSDGLDHSSDISVRYYSSGAGVHGIGQEPVDARSYDLHGKAADGSTKGIIIRSGKKFVIK